MRIRVLLPGLSALALALPAGCGGDPDTANLVPVTGTLTLDGKPLEGATLSFVPDPGNPASTLGTDVSGPGGSFAAKYRNRPGLSPGKYKVSVARPLAEAAGGGDVDVPEDMTEDPYMASLSAHGEAGADAKAKAPDPYADPSTSPLTLEVSENGEEGLVFDVKSTVR